MSLPDRLSFFEGHKHLGGVLVSDQLRLMVLAYFLWVASTIVHCRLQRFHRRLKHCAQLLRPIYRQFADNQNAEIFSANTLLVILGTSLLTARAGLSMGSGSIFGWFACGN
uniref:uncharacterized protein LOC101302599 n=1 Tax=Fragaria vesca subsp. vesca TaxID=101020 RepID=UPI0005CB25BC|nr:PREDICTED: uncharacterized protein LOC101302599 [Fragaria vesca subsp. vesca]